MSNKEAYQQKLQAQFDEWAAEVEKLKAKADKADADARLAYNREIEDLREKQNEVRAKLGELADAGEGAWGDIKAGAEDALGTFGRSIRAARERFA